MLLNSAAIIVHITLFRAQVRAHTVLQPSLQTARNKATVDFLTCNDTKNHVHFCVLRKLTVKVSLVLPGLGVNLSRGRVSCLRCSSIARGTNVREQQSSALLL